MYETDFGLCENVFMWWRQASAIHKLEKSAQNLEWREALRGKLLCGELTPYLPGNKHLNCICSFSQADPWTQCVLSAPWCPELPCQPSLVVSHREVCVCSPWLPLTLSLIQYYRTMSSALNLFICRYSSFLALSLEMVNRTLTELA